MEFLTANQQKHIDKTGRRSAKNQIKRVKLSLTSKSKVNKIRRQKTNSL